MRNNSVAVILSWSLIALLCSRPSALRSSPDESTKVKVVVERVERVNRSKAHFSLRVVNESAAPVFLEAYPFDLKILDGLYLEQWRTEEGWKVVLPCRDLFASDTIKLKPGEAMTQEREMTFPITEGACKERNIHFEGRFRFRLDYFESANGVRKYIEQMDSAHHEPRPPAFAVSEPFEIPALNK